MTVNSSKIYEVVVKTDENINALKLSNLTSELEKVKSAKEMKTFLKNHIRWNVLIYEIMSLNSSSENTNSILFSEICKPCENEKEDDRDFASFIILIYILGVVSVLGNVVTVVYEFKTLITLKRRRAKGHTIYSILVINLCIAQLLIGIGFITLATLSLDDPKSSSLCSALGVIHAMSVQASASFLAIITGYRLCGILFPLKRIQLKTTVAFSVSVWILWLIVAALPLFNESLFAHEFSREIVVNTNNDTITIKLQSAIKTFRTLGQEINFISNEPFGQVLNVLNQYTSNEVIFQLLQSFNLTSFELGEPYFKKFYEFNSGCTFYALIESTVVVKYFLMFLFIFSFIEFLFILISYFIIMQNISAFRFKKLFPCLTRKISSKIRSRKISKVEAENRKIYIRIFIIIITDLMVFVPLYLLGLLYYFNSVSFGCEHWENIAAILLFLNSLINPYIYSFNFWSDLFRRGKRRLPNCISLKVNFSRAT